MPTSKILSTLWSKSAIKCQPRTKWNVTILSTLTELKFSNTPIKLWIPSSSAKRSASARSRSISHYWAIQSVLMVHPTGVPHAKMLFNAMLRSTVRRRLAFHCSKRLIQKNFVQPTPNQVQPTTNECFHIATPPTKKFHETFNFPNTNASHTRDNIFLRLYCNKLSHVKK